MQDASFVWHYRHVGHPPTEKGFGLDPRLKKVNLSPVRISIDHVEIRSKGGKASLRNYLEFLRAMAGFSVVSGQKLSLFHKSDGYMRTATIEELRELALEKAEFVDC